MSSAHLNPDHLAIRTGQSVSYGGQQDWYASPIRRWSGCGPTTAATITMCRRRATGAPVYEVSQFLQLMNTMWTFITPGQRGVDSLEYFIAGYDQFLASQHLSLTPRALPVGRVPASRPRPEPTFAFLQTAFTQDCAVAFLNLHHGQEKRLESWHWVTLVGADYEPTSETLLATMADGGRLQEIDLGLWLATSRQGGGLVYFAPAAAHQPCQSV